MPIELKTEYGALCEGINRLKLGAARGYVMKRMLDRYFGITEAGSNYKTEIVGGITTFATMSYIVFVQPTVLHACGVPFGSALLATCFSAAVACVLMGILSRYPFALAPGMGENFFFSFTVCSTFPGAMGFSWHAGLAIVLISGIIFVALSLIRAREKMLGVLPDCLKNAIGPAIGFFIAFVGLQWGGIIVKNDATMVALGSLKTGPALITIFGVLVIVVLRSLSVQGAILLGILATCGMGVLTGVMPRTGQPVDLGFETFFNLNFSELFEKWDVALIAIVLFFFMDFFDTVGTLVGLSKQAGYMGDDGKLPRASRAFLADAIATCVGALFGTSTVTTYVESATGIAAGARTGLAAIVTGICFIVAVLLADVVQVVGQDVGAAFYGVDATSLHIAMYPGVAPALIIVGFMMMAPLRKVKWDDMTESLPAFLTVAMMVLSFAIHEGIAMGCVAYVAVKTLSGRAREVHPVMYGVALALVLRYIFLV